MPSLARDAASAAADAVLGPLDGGSLRLYTAPKPTDADTAVTTQTLLAELTLSTPAFGPAVDGVAVAGTITGEDDAPASGNASWFRVVTSGGDAIFDGTVGTSGADLNLSTRAVQQHGTVDVSSLTYTQSRV